MTTSFTLTRKRKVELSSVSAPLDEAALQNLAARRDSTVSEQCLAGAGKLMLMILGVITFSNDNDTKILLKRINDLLFPLFRVKFCLVCEHILTKNEVLRLRVFTAVEFMNEMRDILLILMVKSWCV